MRNNNITIIRKRGKKSLVNKTHITFLKKYFEKKSNVGKSFKEAF